MTRLALLATLVFASAALGQQPPAAQPKGINPTQENVPYGTHSRQVLDLYQAKLDKPTPVVFAIHGKEGRDSAFANFHDQRDKLLPWIEAYSPIYHVTSDDPPVFMEFPSQKKPPVKGEPQDDPTHSALFGLILMEKLNEAKVEGIVAYPGKPHEKYKGSADYLIDRLKKSITP